MVPWFSQGQAYSWQEEFGPEHHREFNDRYRDILETYGYPPEPR